LIHVETLIDPGQWSAGRVAAAIARRELSAREYLDLLLGRIATHNPVLNAVTSIDERALRWAKEADDATARGESSGPLHGVSMTVKDSLNTAGLRTTAGATALSGHVPREDAEAVRALRLAGAIVFGKTNLAENCMDVQTANDVFGVSRNPWHPDRTPGGSSGGAAAAVAAGLTAAELGSDIAGSIRIPASNCGVFGHKPSFGVVPLAGHIPPYQPTRPDLAVVGPLGRDVDDLRLLLSVIAGPDPLDRPAWRLTLPPPQPVRTVALWTDDPYCPVAGEVRDAVERAGSALAQTGVVVEPAVPAGISLAANDEVMRRSLATAGLAAHAGLGGEFAAQSHHDWLQAQDRRTRIQRAWHRFFQRYDAVLLPVSVRPAIPHDARPFAERRITVDGAERPYWDQIVWAGLAGVGHLPVTVVPVGLDTCGTPIGVAVTGPYLGDLTTLEVAQRLTDALGGIGRPPMATPRRRNA
jgi:amidase